MWGRKAAAAQAVEGAGVRSSWQQHSRVLSESYHRLWQTPFLSLLTIFVVAVAWILPAQMALLLQQGDAFLNNWPHKTQMMVYLKPGEPLAQANQLKAWLVEQSAVERVDVIAPEAALAEFKQLSGFHLEDLEANPLPVVLKVTPREEQSQELAPLKVQLLTRADVDDVQLDELWLQRLSALLDLGQSILLVVGVSLGVTVLLVVVSVVRLMIEGHRAEIQVIKLIGATNAFVRRPFLYSGVWYGLLGGGVALVSVWAINLWLSKPWKQVLVLFDARVEQVYPGFCFSLSLLAISALLGMIGAWLAVLRHLNAVEPQ